MELDEYRAAVERECGAITSALRAGPVDAKVPTCPGWTLVELGTHLGQFCGLWTHVLCEAAGRPKTPFEEPPNDTPDAAWFAAWFGEQAGYLTELLGSVRGDTPAWTWDETNKTAGFIGRRAAHELSVHRFDVQSARGTPDPIDGPLAVDGIEEIFAMLRAWRAQGQHVGEGGGETVHLHATNPDAEWTITLTADGPKVERAHTKADLAVRGTASDLELLLYDRPTTGEVGRSGDESVLKAWKAAFHFA